MLVPALEGRDIIARAKTGTGKTLAFGIPIIKRLTEQAGDYSAFRSFFFNLASIFVYTNVLVTRFSTEDL